MVPAILDPKPAPHWPARLSDLQGPLWDHTALSSTRGSENPGLLARSTCSVQSGSLSSVPEPKPASWVKTMACFPRISQIGEGTGSFRLQGHRPPTKCHSLIQQRTLVGGHSVPAPQWALGHGREQKLTSALLETVRGGQVLKCSLPAGPGSWWREVRTRMGRRFADSYIFIARRPVLASICYRDDQAAWCQRRRLG